MNYKTAKEGEGVSVMDGELANCPPSAFDVAVKGIIRDNLRPTRMNAGDTDRRRLTLLLTEAFLAEFAPHFVDKDNPRRTATKDIEFERAIWDGLKGLCFDCAPLEREMKTYKGVRLGRVALDLSAPAFVFAQKPLGFVEWATVAAARALEILKEEIENGAGKEAGGGARHRRVCNREGVSQDISDEHGDDSGLEREGTASIRHRREGVAQARRGERLCQGKAQEGREHQNGTAAPQGRYRARQNRAKMSVIETRREGINEQAISGQEKQRSLQNG